MPAVREAFVEGLFYAPAPAALRAQVVDYLAGGGAADDAGRTPKLLIAPYAGYEYRGPVARLCPAVAVLVWLAASRSRCSCDRSWPGAPTT